ncbi:MAG: hypothetical protein BM555_02470 [Crocinitomix sp. MedPE-SWsnd]|nr:MAG: hypothetical protein BM555_02470 [Crocinitomix sp. MedPE-SWsnd]
MKNEIKVGLFVALLAVAFGFQSCKSTSKSYHSSTVRSRDVQLDPIKADIKVDETKKLEGKSSATYIFGIRVKGDDKYADGINYSTNSIRGFREGGIKAAAAYKALEGGDWDVLVHPTYTVSRQWFFFGTKYEIEVKGYGAKYENFRSEPDTMKCCPQGLGGNISGGGFFGR